MKSDDFVPTSGTETLSGWINAATCGKCDSTDWKVVLAVTDEGVWDGDLYGNCMGCGLDIADPIHDFEREFLE